MSYQKYIQCDQPVTGTKSLKPFCNYQEVLSLLQVSVHATDQVITVLDRISGFISRLNPDEANPMHNEFIGKLLVGIDEIVLRTEFRNILLFDGNSGITGESTNPNIEFIRCGNSPSVKKNVMLPVTVYSAATRSYCESDITLSDTLIRQEKYLYFKLGGRHYEFSAQSLTTVPEFVAHLQRFLMASGIDCFAALDENKSLTVFHSQPGSNYHFSVLSPHTPMFTDGTGNYKDAQPGKDITGRIGNAETGSFGGFLTAFSKTEVSDGLILHVKNNVNTAGESGYIKLSDGSWVYREASGDDIKISLPSLKAADLGKGMFNVSGFKSLADIRLNNPRECADSLLLTQWVRAELVHTLSGLRQKEEKMRVFCMNDLSRELDKLLSAPERISEAGTAANLAKGLKSAVNVGSRFAIYT